jgi:hypothetical protein
MLQYEKEIHTDGLGVSQCIMLLKVSFKVRFEGEKVKEFMNLPVAIIVRLQTCVNRMWGNSQDKLMK